MAEGEKRGGAEQGSEIDLAERAGHHTGNPQVLDTRLFMQLLVFDCAPELSPSRAVESLASGLREHGATGVMYQDLNAPRGIGLLTFSEDAEYFVKAVRPAVLAAGPGLTPRRDFTMIGRTYATGYEPDLAYWLLRRPVETVCNEKWPWAVWYPLRRQGPFNRLDGRERASILKEHGQIGRAYGELDYAHDVRLACHGIDQNDNDFVIGLIGKELYPLSHVVESMRKTRQTAEFMEQMGPFFVGYATERVT